MFRRNMRRMFKGEHHEKQPQKAVAVLCGTMMAASLSLTACGGASTAESVDLREVPLDTILEKAKEEGPDQLGRHAG